MDTIAIEEFLADLDSRGIYVYLQGGKLKLRTKLESVPQALLAQIKANKEHLISYMSQHDDKQGNLSSAQQRIWFISQYEQQSYAYNMAGLIKLSRAISANALNFAINSLLSRYDILRSNFFDSESGGIQKVNEEYQFSLTVRPTDPNTSKTSLIKQLHNELTYCFDLANELLIRGTLFADESGEQGQWLYLSMHHIVADGWSVGLFVQALLEELSERTAANDNPLQYRDYVYWESQFRQTDDYQKQLAYWQNQLSSLELFELPTCHARSASKNYDGDTIYFTVANDLLSRFEQRCQHIEITPFVGFLSVFYGLLYRYSHKQDITLGVPVLNRTQTEFEDMIGCFINTLPMRVRLEQSVTFAQLAAMVKDMAKHALANQNVALEDIISTLNLPKSSAHSALFQVLFNYNGVDTDKLSAHGLSAELVPLDNHSAKFDLTLNLSRNGSGLTANIDYSTQLFDSAFIETFASDFIALVEAFCDQHQQSIAHASLPSVQKADQLLTHQPTQQQFVSIVELITQQAKKHPQKVALYDDGDNKYSYAELDSLSAQLASGLRNNRRYTDDKTVALLVNRSADSLVAMLGIMRAGLAYLPIEQGTPLKRILEVLNQANSTHLITINSDVLSADDTAKLTDESIMVNAYETLIANEAFIGPISIDTKPDDCAYVMFTSGSTGVPKGVMVPHRALASYIQGVGEVIEFTSQTKSAVLTGLATDLCLTGIYPVLANGGSVVFLAAKQSQLEPQFIVNELQRQQINLVKITPSFANEILPLAIKQKSSTVVKQWVLGGEPLTESLVQAVRDYCPDAHIYNHYGPTETCIGVSAYKLAWNSESNWGSYSIGNGFSHVYLKVLNSYLQSVPAGSAGELFIGGDSVALGYINAPEINADAFVTIQGQRFYRTGDKVRLNNAGQLEYLGRLDNQVKIRGFRVDLQDIESKLNALAQVKSGVVISKPQADSAALVAFVVPEPNGLSTAQIQLHITADLKLYLPEPMVPSVIVVCEQLPMLANGKIDRNALSVQPLQLDSANFVEPSTDVQRTLANIFEQLTGRTRIGIHDDFFAIGGHSLLAMKLLNRVRDSFEISLSLKTIFANPTIAELAECLQRAQIDSADKNSNKGYKQNESVHFGTHHPLSFSQQRLWFIDQFQGHSSQYNLQGIFKLHGELDRNALEAAFNNIIERHRILKFNYKVESGADALQFENELAKFSLVFHDLTALDAHHQSNRIEQTIESDYKHSFDLERDLMIRGQLIRLQNTEHVLIVTMHHIVSDGWSIDILCKELTQFYAQHIRGELPSYQQLSNSYVDYVYWQRHQFQSANNTNELDYWRTKLAGIPKVHDLPTDRARRNESLVGGALYCQAMPASLEAKLREYIKASGHTLFLVLQTAFGVWMSRLSQQQTIALGTPVSGRETSEFEPLIGNFINTLVLYNEVNPDNTFAQALCSFKQTLNEALQNQSIPFDLLVEQLNVERNIAIHPLIQIVFRVNNQINEALQLEGVQVELLDAPIRQAKLDLEVSVIDSHEQIVVEWLYDNALWDQKSIERFFAQYCHIIEQCLTHSDTQLAKLEVCSKVEQAQLLKYARYVEIDAVQAPNWVHKFSLLAQQQPDHIAVRNNNTSLTYAQLDMLSNQLAHSLLEMEFSVQSRIGILLPSSMHMVLGVIAILKAQHVYVPLHIDTPVDGLATIVDDANMTLILALSSDAPRLIECGTDFLLLDDIFEQQGNFSIYPATYPEVFHTHNAHELLCYIIYTSGSTGKPKGVAITYSNLNAYLQHACTQYIEHTEELKESIVSTPLAFDATVTSLIPMLITGGTVNILSDDASQLSVLTEALFHSPNNVLFKLTPAHLQAIQALSDGLFNYDCKHIVVVGGEALPVSLISSLKNRLPQVSWINEYGPTETTVGSSIYTVEPHFSLRDLEKLPDMPIGLPIEQVGMIVVDKFDQLAPFNTPGELLICGPVVSPGYINQTPLNDKKFVDIRVPFKEGTVKQRFYRTGDIVKWYSKDGIVPSYIRFCGRSDDVIKLRGYRIDTGSLCHHIRAFDAIVDCAVTMDVDGAFLCAHYVVTPHSSFDVKKLKKHLANKLPAYMVPSKFNQVEYLPLTPNGKVDLTALHTQFVNAAVQPPAKMELATLTALQAYLLQLYSEMLQAPNVMLEDSFFELGGHSLLAIRLISQIRADKNFDITLEQLFKTPSVLSLAEALEQCPLIDDSNIIVSVSRSKRLPLSYAQHRLWLIEQVQQGATQYHMPASFELTGVLNINAFQQALNAVISRHEVLRTHILPGSSGEAPEQLINERFDVPCVVHDLSTNDDEAIADKIANLKKQALLAPFNLTTDVLLRVMIIKLSAQHHHIHFNMHHIASDGWSMAILVREFIAFYRHFNGESGFQLPTKLSQPLQIQYADFAYWQRQLAQQKEVENSLNYWQNQLQNIPSLHQLPLDKPRPSLQQLEGETYTQYLSPSITQAIHKQCAQQGVTLFMWLHSVFSLLVMRFSQTSDVLIGSPVAGREQSEVSDLIGFFVNTLVIRAQTEGTQSFAAFLQQQKNVIVDAFKHQTVPFEQLVELLQPERNLAHQPLFQILFALQNNEVTEFELPDLQITQLPTQAHNMKFDLEVNAIERDSGIELQWNFATSLFKRTSIKQLADSFSVMITALLETPSLNIATVPLNTPEQQLYLANLFAPNQSDDENRCDEVHSLVTQLNQVMTRCADDVAVITSSGMQLSFFELQQRALQLAALLRANNVEKGDRVAICLPASSDMIVAVIATWYVGAAYVPVDPKLPIERANFIIQDARVSCLVTNTQTQQLGIAEYCEQAAIAVANIDELTQRNITDVLSAEVKVAADDLAYIIYTSGTTGQPKGVAISHANISVYLNHAQAHYLGERQKVSVLSTPLAFDASVTSIWAPLLSGVAVMVLPDDDTLIDTLASQVFSPTSGLFKLTPAHLQALLNYLPAQPVLSTHVMVVGGEALSVQLLEQFAHVLPNCLWVNEYGPTEATVGTCVYSVNKDDIQKLITQGEHNVPIGRAIMNTHLLVVDEHQQLVPLGVCGELYISGANLAQGYFDNQALTKDKFVSMTLPGKNSATRYYRSGDKVRWLTDEQGEPTQLQFYGRYDHQVKLRGYRIELSEVEHHLTQVPQVEQAVVLLNQQQEALEAFVVLKEDGNSPKDKPYYVLSQEQLEPLLQHVAKFLPHYMQPNKVIALNAVPLTINGKVDTKKLQLISNESELITQKVSPRNELETSLTEIFAALLNVQSVGITDSFFALGGHSLLATQCASIIKEQLNIDIPVKVLFERPTIAALSQWYAINQAAENINPQDSTSDTSEEMFL
ncbi:amino acid adenylation domain-containing protein [Pseudoalteromonas sp. JBTF-M23]|uniref:Amino acid adenylation domain-containing protein n=1 Tax=Pseudoalteromonas caenipelagi TaxID=2726988 RepID=A0A849V6F6_9GAMM|nr:non-ribosomal peptide synthetase [Pseudoalteromonas caenipelagi]NOU49089.1 amino acid adenylation domain-containing protein [Pseudoalteromonas caenipelagi]